MLTSIGLKLSLKINQNCSKHTHVKMFDQNHLSISISLLKKKKKYFPASIYFEKITFEHFAHRNE